MYSKSYRKWEARINDHASPWTESEIVYFRKATGPFGLKDRGERVALQALFRDTLTDIDGYRITRQQDVKGQAYVLTKSLKKNFERRKGCKFTDLELKVFKELEHHLLVGMYFPQHGLEWWLPVFRAIGGDGAWVEYVGAPYELMVVLRSSTGRPEDRRRAMHAV